MSPPNDIARAMVLIDTKRWADARRALGAYIARVPDDSEAWCQLARAHLGEGDSGSALAASRRAIALAPESGWGYRLLSIALTLESDYDNAREAADQAVRLAPMSWQSHYQRASVDVSARAIDEETWAALRQATAMAPSEEEVHQLNGLAALHTKKLRTAAAAFREALRLNPQNAEAMNNLGLVQYRRGNYPSATTSFMSALRIAPTNPRYIHNLGGIVRAWVVLISFVGALGCLAMRAFTEANVVREPGRPTQHVPVTGRPLILLVMAALVVCSVGYGVWAVRRGIGSTSLRAILSGNRHNVTLVLVTLVSTVTILVIVATPVAGMPAAQPLAVTGLALSVFNGVLAQLHGGSKYRDGRVAGQTRRS